MNKEEQDRLRGAFLHLLSNEGLSIRSMKMMLSAINDVPVPNAINQRVALSVLRQVIIKEKPLEAPIYLGMIR